MANDIFRILWMAVWVTVVAAATIKNVQELPGQRFFKEIPENERPYYLSFELSRGYTERASEYGNRQTVEDIVFPEALDIAEDLVEKFEALEVPDNFTQNLFEHVKNEFDLDYPAIRTLILRREICFENGKCIDLNDVGAICCPF